MGLVTITKRCPFCDASSQIQVDEKDYERHLAGVPARTAFLDLTSAEVRLIRTGVCMPCDAVIHEDN